MRSHRPLPRSSKVIPVISPHQVKVSWTWALRVLSRNRILDTSVRATLAGALYFPRLWRASLSPVRERLDPRCSVIAAESRRSSTVFATALDGRKGAKGSFRGEPRCATCHFLSAASPVRASNRSSILFSVGSVRHHRSATGIRSIDRLVPRPPAAGGARSWRDGTLLPGRV
jgi:hypothetical protein